MYLYGAGGHAKVIAETLQENGIVLEGIYCDNPSSQSFKGIPVWADCCDNIACKEFIIGVGDNNGRKRIVKKLVHARFGKAISKYAHLSHTVTIGEGSVVMKGVSVNLDTNIGNHVILNTNCSIDHDCHTDDFVHIAPNAALAGGVHVGEGTHVGMGACILQGIKVGAWATIGAGAVVIRDIPDYAVAVGNPAKIIKYNK